MIQKHVHLNFRYPYYITRCYIAGIDHNFHANRKQAKTKSGKPIYMRKYCKRTKHWHAQPVKEEKIYRYLPHLMAKVLYKRYADEESSSRSAERLPSDPKRIAPTIGGHQQPPATVELIESRKSRFSKKNV